MCKENGSHRDCDCGCGCVGPQGPQGIPGLQGVQGVPGIAGQDGKPGPMGPQGFQGVPGPVGQPGMQGPQGVPGPMGQQGAQGQQGPAGSQGLQGPAGNDGQNGATGAQGPLGPMGPQGPQGIQGVPGKDCDCDHNQNVPGYLSLYSLSDQVLDIAGGPNDFAILENLGVGTSTDFDWSLAATTGEIKILVGGIYQVQWDACGQLNPPFTSPVPSWGLSMYRNGAVLPGSTVASFSQSPDDDSNCIAALINVRLNVGDVLKIRNISTYMIFLKSVHPELIVPVTSASFSILRLDN